jgi:tensin
MSPNADGNGSVYGGQSRRSSIHSSSGDTVTQEVSPANIKFVRDTSRYWYKPNISREEGEIYKYMIFVKSIKLNIYMC